MKVSRRIRKYSLILVVGCAIFAVLCFAVIYYREKPRVQLIQQSLATTTKAISYYIDEFGEMPASIDELAAAGFVSRISPRKPRGLSDERATTIYRLNFPNDDRVIYYWNDIVVNWGADEREFELRDGILVNRSNGEPDFIIGRRDLFNNEKTVYHLGFSIELYNRIVDRGGKNWLKANLDN